MDDEPSPNAFADVENADPGSMLMDVENPLALDGESTPIVIPPSPDRLRL